MSSNSAFAGLPATPKVYDEIQSFRLVLETGIAASVVERIDPPTIAKLTGLIERMGATDDCGNRRSATTTFTQHWSQYQETASSCAFSRCYLSP